MEIDKNPRPVDGFFKAQLRA